MFLQNLHSKARNTLQSKRVYSHRLYKKYQYADSVREFLAQKRCSWIVERIFALQSEENGLKNHDTQLWNFIIQADGSGLMVCIDDLGRIIYSEPRYASRYPTEDVSFVLRNDVLYLRN